MRETHIDRGTEAETEVLVDGYSHQNQHPNRTILVSTETESRVIGISVLHSERVTNTGTPRSRMLQGLPIRHRVLPNQKTVIHQDRNNSIVRSINRAITHEIVKQSEGVPEVHRLQIASEAASNTINSATTAIAPVLKTASETRFHLLEKPIIIFLARDQLREQ